MTPNPATFTVFPGDAHTGVFETLNASPRNCNVVRSWMRKFLNSDASRLCVDGARRSGEVRDVVPNVKLPACEKSAVLKYWLSLLSTAPLSFADWPLLFGRCPGEPRNVLFPPLLICSGSPVR